MSYLVFHYIICVIKYSAKKVYNLSDLLSITFDKCFVSRLPRWFIHHTTINYYITQPHMLYQCCADTSRTGWTCANFVWKNPLHRYIYFLCPAICSLYYSHNLSSLQSYPVYLQHYFLDLINILEIYKSFNDWFICEQTEKQAWTLQAANRVELHFYLLIQASDKLTMHQGKPQWFH